MSFPVPLPSTFMPLPLAIMIPFMGIQSGVMAQQFGMNFQYGKRKISAMSNEEFNKLTPQQMQVDFSNQITGMIPTFEKSLQEMRPFQRMIFIEMIAAFKEAVQLGLDIAGAGLGINTSLPNIPTDKFAPPPGFEEHPSSLTKPPTQVTSPGFHKPFKKPNKGVTQTDVSIKGLPKAGQTQILERNKLIKQIAQLGKSLKAHLSTENKGMQKIVKAKITKIQLQLTTLLGKYNWI